MLDTLLLRQNCTGSPPPSSADNYFPYPESMQVSALLAEFEKREAVLGEYRGVVSARNLDEPAFTPALLQQSVLLYDWSWRERLLVQGPDARKWLNGMISANVQALEPGAVVPSFQLDPKGHILATFDIACLAPEKFLLITGASQATTLAERLRRYVFISKLQIVTSADTPAESTASPDDSVRATSLALRGAGARSLLRQAGFPAVPESPGLRLQTDTPVGPVTLTLSRPGGEDQIEIEFSPHQAPALWTRLRQAGAVAAGTAAQESDRILSGVPRFGLDIRGSELPQETGQMEALNFSKGCYVGQEIVERVRSRGSVHRLFSAFVLQAPVPESSSIRIDDKEVGLVTSLTGLDGEVAALGYIRRPYNEPGTIFTVEGVEGRVRTRLSFLQPE